MGTKKQINWLISVVFALYVSIKGSMINGWFSCVGVTEVAPCGFFRWFIQIVVLIIIVNLILLGIEYFLKELYKKYVKKRRKKQIPKEEKKEVKKEKKKVVKKEKEELEEEKPKKVVKI